MLFPWRLSFKEIISMHESKYNATSEQAAAKLRSVKLLYEIGPKYGWLEIERRLLGIDRHSPLNKCHCDECMVMDRDSP